MSGDMDSWARSQGYPSYEAMKAFLAQRSSSLQDSHTTSTPHATPEQALGSGAGVLNYLTPFGIMNFVKNKFSQAVGDIH